VRMPSSAMSWASTGRLSIFLRCITQADGADAIGRQGAVVEAAAMASRWPWPSKASSGTKQQMWHHRRPMRLRLMDAVRARFQDFAIRHQMKVQRQAARHDAGKSDVAASPPSAWSKSAGSASPGKA